MHGSLSVGNLNNCGHSLSEFALDACGSVQVYKGAFLGEENEEYVEELLNESWDGFLVIADIVGAIMCSCQQSQDLTHAEADEATRQRAIRHAARFFTLEMGSCGSLENYSEA